MTIKTKVSIINNVIKQCEEWKVNTMGRRYYTAESSHGSDSSHGFRNDTIVMVWASRHARDNYLLTTDNISATPINRSQATTHATNWSMTANCDNKPRPFSGECWYIDDDCADSDIGLIGSLDYKIMENWDKSERFYK